MLFHQSILVLLGICVIFLCIVEANPIIADDENTDDLIDLSQYGTQMFGQPDSNIGDLIAEFMNFTESNPEEMGSYLEGDLLIPHGAPRNGIVGNSYRWPGAVIPYEVSNSFSSRARAMIVSQCLEAYHKQTCIKFRPRTASDKNYLVITNERSGCWSSVGMNGGRQVLNLQESGCVTKVGTCIHEMMHAVGFLHEQTRTDRDSYVRVNYNNIRQGYENNFEKGKSGQIDAQGVGYDYGSVMHYNLNAFSKNGQPTMTVLKSTTDNVGQRDGFSKKDVAKINKMYKCNGKVSDASPESGGGGGINNFIDNIFGLVNNGEDAEEFIHP
uniref:Metalloendopeptidase n=1 Tax=Culicoides sonorensis TaxID=179676 RepID=A0A336KT28_CULSO